MEWRKSYLDLLLVPLSILIHVLYHAWLWNMVRTQPRRTTAGINTAGRRLWVRSVMKESEKKNVLAVQTLRNSIMSSTLMGSTCVLLCSALAAILSSTYSVKKPISESIYGANGDLMVALKYVTLLHIFFFAFVSYSLSVQLVSQVSFLINAPTASGEDSLITPQYVSDMLEKGSLLSTLGNRFFYVALALLFWIFGPVLVFICSVFMVPALYNCDVVCQDKGGVGGEKRADFFSV